MKDIVRQDIKPAFAVRNVPVVLATDRNFLCGVAATIRSIAASPGNDHIVVHICHDDIPAVEQERFLAGLPTCGRVAVDFVDITAAIEEHGLSRLKYSLWFTQATSYRMLLPGIFPDEDRLIYLDADTIVLHDLGELYRTDLRGNWLAAVRGFGYPGFVAKSKKRQEWHLKTGLPVETYFNDGLMLIDCAAFRAHDLVQVLVKTAAENNGRFLWPDQDALNVVCRGHVRFLDDRWNVTTSSCRSLAENPGGEHFATLLENPFVLHYTGRVKPWHDAASFKADLWWRFFAPGPGCAAGARPRRNDTHRPRQTGENAVDISVVIPTHRRHLFLRAALQSVFKQKGVGFEVIVVNGVEDDKDTDAVVSEFDVVKYIRSKEYLSCSSKRSLGLSLAKGRYIHFIDDDDYMIDDDFYMKAVALLDSNGEISSFSGNSRFRYESTEGGEPKYSDAAPLPSGRINGLEYFSKFQLEWGKPNLIATVFRKAALVADGTLHEVNDSSIYLQSLLHGDAFIIDDYVCVYRKWFGSISHGGEGNDLRLKMDTAIQKERFYRIASGKIADADKWWRGTFAMNLDYFRRTTPDSRDLLLFAAWGILHSHGDAQLVAKCVSTLGAAFPETFARLQNHAGAPKMPLHLRAMLHKAFRGVSGNYEPYYSEIMARLDAETGKNREALDAGLMYFTEFRNFGDMLSRRLVECLSGLGMNGRPMDAADIAAVGSILRQLRRCFDRESANSGPLHVWGSGFPQTIALQNPRARGRVIFHAVRGELTLRHLRELGLVEPEESVALGDPGLLYADIVPGARETRKEFDVAIVPHHIDAEEFKAAVDWLSSAGLSVKFVDVSDANPMQVVRDIAASRKVLSSSLHGIIVADSLGIPNLRVVADGFEEDEQRMLDESHLKFSDYYSAFGLERPKHICLSELKDAPRRTIDRIVDFVPRDKVEKCKRGLLDAFPFPRRTAAFPVREELPEPCVSVVLPVYNSEYYLRECLDSVLLQEQFTSLELICVDDGSADSSARIAETYALRDRRVRLIRQKNSGPGVARNAGLDAAKGEYVFFLDADDRLSSGAALRQAYERVKADDLDVLVADALVMNEQGVVEARKSYLRENLVPEGRVWGPEAFGAGLYLISPMAPWAKLYRRSFLAENTLVFPALRRSEDFPFVQLALSLARRLGVMNHPLIERRVGVATSLESTKDKTPLLFIDAERIYRKELDRRGLSGKFKDAANAAFSLRLAYNLRAVRTFASYKAIFDETRELFAAWTSCGDGDGISEACRKAKAYLDDVFGAQASDSDLVQRFIDDCTVRIRGEARQRVEQLERDMNMLKSALQESQRARGKVWAEREAMKAAMLAAKTELAEAQKRRGEVWAEREAMKAELLAAKSELAAAQKRRGEVWAEREAMKAELLAAKSELAAAQKRRGEVWAEREAMKAELLAAKSELAAAQKRRSEVWAERCTLSAQVLGLKKKLDEIDRITGL